MAWATFYIVDYRGGKVFEVVHEPSAYAIIVGRARATMAGGAVRLSQPRMDLGTSSWVLALCAIPINR